MLSHIHLLKDSLGHGDSFSGVSPISKRMLAFVAVVNTFVLQFLGYVVFENSLCSCLTSLSIKGTKTGNFYMIFLLKLYTLKNNRLM